MRLLRPLADQGNADAQFEVGNMYLKGRGVPQDYAQAAVWLRAAADQGNAKGKINLGWMYESSHGVTQDYALAVTWYPEGSRPRQCDGRREPCANV